MKVYETRIPMLDSMGSQCVFPSNCPRVIGGHHQLCVLTPVAGVVHESCNCLMVFLDIGNATTIVGVLMCMKYNHKWSILFDLGGSIF